MESLRIAFVMSFFIAVSGCGAHKMPICDSSPQFAKLDPYLESHIVVFGEFHGSQESPELFSELACHAAKNTSHLLVGVEMDTIHGDTLNLAIKANPDPSDIIEAAKTNWTTHDGRSSDAMLQMILGLSELNSRGGNVSLFAFDQLPSNWSSSVATYNNRAALMAANVDEEVATHSGAVIVLTGSTHARKASFDFDHDTYVPMASLIASKPVLSMGMNHRGGDVWVSMRDANSGQTIGQEIAIPPSQYTCAAGSIFVLDQQTTENGMDGSYCLGELSPSYPAFPNAD